MARYLVISLTFLLILFTASAQELTSSAAKDFLPAFQKDDSVLFKTENIRHQADGEVLLSLAVVTNCPQIFRYVLDHYPGVDAEFPLNLALRIANQTILEVALKNQKILGEYSVNHLLAPAWTKDEDDLNMAELMTELILYSCLPESSVSSYSPLLFTPRSDAERANVAVWLIGQQQPFHYSHLPQLNNLAPEFKPVVQLLIKRLSDLPQNQSIPGFTDHTEAQIFSAVVNNDIAQLKTLAEDAETIEFSIGDYNLLSYAIKYAELPVIKFLLTKGANADWHNIESHESILSAILERNDHLVLQEVIPYIRNTSIRNAEGNTSVYFCVKSFFDLATTADHTSKRNFYLFALKALRNSGADFNQENGRYVRPADLIPDKLDDSLSRSVAILVLEQTSDQTSLSNYASKFSYLGPADMQVLTFLSQKLSDTSPLFYNESLEKANLFTVILKESVRLPGLRVFSSLLRSACYYKNVQKVRWLLNDVPLFYVKRDYSMNIDSLRKVIVNSPVAGDGENAIYYFLSQEHTMDWSSKSVVKTLMAAGSDLYQMRTFDSKRPIDLLLESASYQKYYANEILAGLLSMVELNCDDPNAWEKEPSTGDLYRKSILAYQRDKIWLLNLKNCVTMDLNGPGISPSPNRQVSITGIGSVNLGTFPVQSCDPINVYKIASSSPLQSVYDFTTRINIGIYPFISPIRYLKDANSLRAVLTIKGNSGLQDMNMSIKGEIAIPATKLDAVEHSIPPILIIRNNSDQVVVQQGNVSTTLVKNDEKVYDRSKGPLSIDYQRNSNESDLWLEIFGRVQDTKYSDLVVPNSNDALTRLQLYAEITRLQNKIRSNPGQTEEERIYRRHNEVIIHLLSEYALQRGFPKKVREEYEQNLVNLGDINQLIEQLGRFYEQHSVIDFSDVPQLKKTLDALINGPGLTNQQRKEYTALVQRLDLAKEVSDLSNSYGELMNSELLQIAERQLDNKKRLDLEIALYTAGGHLKLEEKK